MADRRAYLRNYQRTWVTARRAAYMGDKACVRCESTDDLHLHHIDPTQKVSNRIWSWSTTRIASEVAKCEVLCRPCHQLHHALEMRRHGTRSRYEAGCRCDPCREANNARSRRQRARMTAVGLEPTTG